MKIVLSALCGFCLDLLLGDPSCLAPIHPVVLMGHGIRFLEKALRKLFPRTEKGELFAGAVLAAALLAAVSALSVGSLILLSRLSPALSFLLEVVWCWQALAVKDLRVEAMAVLGALRDGTLEEARRAVGRIVGRDTASLTEDGVTRAAVETVAENFSDGIAAPLFYMLIGGAPLALCYKAVNTMDSMIGYKNDRYLFFGRAAARLDDAANYVPARISALLLIASAWVTGQDAKEAHRIWRRDAGKHESPNSGQCEAAMAGALNVRLCGPASYFGIRHDKPWIGDNRRPIKPEDIRTACRMEMAGSLFALALFCLARRLILLG